MKLYQVTPEFKRPGRTVTEEEFADALEVAADLEEGAPAGVFLASIGYRYSGGRVSGSFMSRARSAGFTVSTFKRGGLLVLRITRRDENDRRP